jgi:hypothetical protein
MNPPNGRRVPNTSSDIFFLDVQVGGIVHRGASFGPISLGFPSLINSFEGVQARRMLSQIPLVCTRPARDSGEPLNFVDRALELLGIER